jgi:putative DNA primase/helicase
VKSEEKQAQQLAYDKEFSIYTATTRFASKWKHHTLTISKLIQKLSDPRRTNETFSEYLNLPKDEQDVIKDVGSFVGGVLRGGERKRGCVVNRSLLTFDLDYCKPEILKVLSEKLNDTCHSYYSTHKHSSEKPRLRLLVYPDRPLFIDEYQPVCRKIAEKIDIEAFDDSTYQLNRLFYWPSASSDGEFVWGHHDAPFLNVSKTLASYGSGDAWKDAGRWKYSSRETIQIDRAIKKQADPLTKKGIVGAFCRKVSIHEAIQTYLSDIYRKESDTRYSYMEGTTSNGLVIYDGKYAYSNHSTDPCHAQCVNAFDIVRIHKFGHLDKKSSFSDLTHKLPSYQEMSEFARGVDGVKVELIKSGIDVDASEFDAFNEEKEDCESDPETKPADYDWTKDLQLTDKDAKKSNWVNLVIILRNDPKINTKMRYNDFSNIIEKENGENLTKEEIYKIRTYLGVKYKINMGFNDVKQAIEAQSFENRYHPIREYIKSLTWDGTERVERVFIDYVGTVDNPYVREVAKCWFAAAVYRVFEPGYKFDTAIVLSGPQGVGKTRFVETLGLKKWYGELSSFDPKIATEELSGKWIVEISEMSATSRHDLEQQKSFLSARYTRTRLAYEPLPVDYKRQCVFIGSTNEQEYLKDSTGNRRWWPIDCDVKKIEIEKLKKNVDQIWAEAYLLYLARQRVWLDDDALAIACAVQEEKRESDPWEGMIDTWLHEECSIDRYNNNYNQFESDPDRMEIRDRVCVMEVWRDCLKFKGDPRPSERKRIGNILSANLSCSKGGVMRFGSFGSQKGWKFEIPF